MSQENENKAASDAMDRALDMLREHFEAVQILATKMGDNGRTERCYQGSGNAFAREGMARCYLDRMRAIDQHWAVEEDKDADDT